MSADHYADHYADRYADRYAAIETASPALSAIRDRALRIFRDSLASGAARWDAWDGVEEELRSRLASGWSEAAEAALDWWTATDWRTVDGGGAVYKHGRPPAHRRSRYRREE